MRAESPKPLSEKDLARIRETLAHQDDDPITGTAATMEQAMRMLHEDGYHYVHLPGACVSNGGRERVDWDEVGPRLLATLDARKNRKASKT